MKKILLTISLLIFFTANTSDIAFADGETSNIKKKEGATCLTSAECIAGLSCLADGAKIDAKGAALKVCRNLLDSLTQRTSSNAVKNLPSITLESGIAVAIKTVLRSAFLMTIVAIVVAAIYYIISRGKDEDMTKAKDIILYLVIGMAIIAAAYGIVAGITQFNFFG